MLINSLGWAYAFVICFIYGKAVLSRLPNTNTIKLSEIGSPFIEIILGFSVVSTIGAYISLFIPISFIAYLIVIIGAIFFFILDRKKNLSSLFLYWKLFLVYPLPLKLFFVCLTILLLYQSSVGPFHYDTGLYHAQAVHWINNYKAIPGLGNLHFRLAYNSIWFVVTALFNFFPIASPPLHSLNGFFLLVCIFFSISVTQDLITANITISKVYRLMIFLPMLILIYDKRLFSVDVSSISSDLPVSSLSLIIPYFVILKLEKIKKIDGALIPIILLLSLFAICIKISSIPLILFPIYVIVREKRINAEISNSKYIKKMILVFLLVLPQFIRNVIISGYFVYPMQFLGIKFLDWKIPDSVMLADQKMIKVWARMRILGDDGLKNFDQGFKSWIPVWWLNNFNDLILLLFLFSIIIFIAALIAFNKQIKPYIRLILPIYVAQLAYLSFWFFTAPLIRFGYGILTSSSILLILPFVYIVIFDKKMSQLNLALQFI